MKNVNIYYCIRPFYKLFTRNKCPYIRDSEYRTHNFYTYSTSAQCFRPKFVCVSYCLEILFLVLESIFAKSLCTCTCLYVFQLSYSQRNLKSAFFSAKREKSKREIDNFSEKQRDKGEISRRNFSAFRGEISRRFAAKMVIMTWVLKMYSPRFAAKLKP